MRFFAELQRRNVIRAGVLYIGAVWALAQGIAQLAPVFGAPDWVTKWFVIAAAIGFPFWLAFAWVYEWTPQGLKRESEVAADASIVRATGRKMDRAIIAVLAIAVVLLLAERFVPHRGEASAPVAENSIAVLPFVDMSQARDQEYFSDGLSEELLDLLAKVPQLKVIARTSSFSFKGKNLDIAQIAHQLGVATILEGSVRKSGNTLRITAQLIRTSDSVHLWSDTYDRELTDVFKVQDEIAGAVVDALKLKLLQAPTVSAARLTDNTQAHNHYLLGQELMARGSIASYREAAAEYQRALDLDQNYVAAIVGIANAQAAVADLTGDAAAADIALHTADRALAAAPGNPDALAVRAWLRMQFLWDWAGARADYEAALEADPNAIDAMRRYAWLLAALGRLPEAIAPARRAHERDPMGTESTWALGLLLTGSGKAAEAADLMRSSGKAASSEYVGLVLVESLVLSGQAADVSAATSASAPRVQLLGAAFAEHALGRADASTRALDELISHDAAGMAYQIADVYAWRGETDVAFRWLETAYAQHDGGLTTIKFDPFMAPLRADPRYVALVRKLGLPE